MTFIIKGFQAIVFIYIAISTTFRSICPLDFFRCLNKYNKGCSSKFRVGFRVRQTLIEDRRTYRPKRYGNNNKDEDP